MTPSRHTLAADLLRSVAAGDERAMAALVAETRPMVRSILALCGCPLHDRDDVEQEVWLDVWRFAGRYDPAKSRATTWIGTITKRTWIDAYRKAIRRPTVHLGSNTPAPTRDRPDVEPYLQAIAHLPSKARAVVERIMLGGKTYAAAARMLGLPEGTTKSIMHRSMAQLRKVPA